MKTRTDDGWWCKPPMIVEGQSIFWDAQSEIYEHADMTIDNQMEMDVVINACRQVENGDLVTLGGAVGCRDPKMILDDMLSRGLGEKQLPVVFFNDLSPEQVRKAKESVLKPFENKGVVINYLPGEIRNNCKNIPAKPRRLIVGVYDCRSFFTSHPSDGYPYCGFDEYLKNSAILGRDFLLEWVKYTSDHRMVSSGLRARVSVEDGLGTRLWIKKTLDINQNCPSGDVFCDLTALQIIGRHFDNPGFFLSHWYTSHGFSKILKSVFPSDKFAVNMKSFAKGMVFVIDPIGLEPLGVVTVLNNVIGNVLPDDQFETLSAIKEIIA